MPKTSPTHQLHIEGVRIPGTDAMPLELGAWRITGGLKPVEFGSPGCESRLEKILDGVTVA